MNKIKDFLLLVIAVIAIAYSIELISIRRELMLALLEWLRGGEYMKFIYDLGAMITIFLIVLMFILEVAR